MSKPIRPKMKRTDDEVYQILISEKKKRRDTTVAVLAFLLVFSILVTAAVLVIYAKSNNKTVPDVVTIYTNGGSIENSNINTTDSATNGYVNKSNSASAIGGFTVAILITIGGFVCLLCYIRKSKSR